MHRTLGSSSTRQPDFGTLAMKRPANKSDYGLRKRQESALGGGAAPEIRRGPGQIEVPPSPGTLSCTSRSARGEWPAVVI